MKQKFYSLLFASVMGASSLFAAPALQWIDKVDSPTWREDVHDVESSSDGNFFLATTFATSAKMTHTNFYQYDLKTGVADSIATFDGILDTKSNSGQSNILLNKVDPMGELIWSVHSNLGDVQSDYEVAATTDGGAVLLIKAQECSTSSDVLFQIVDNEGNVQQIKWTNPDRSQYGRIPHPILVKVSGEGIVEWVKRYDESYDATPIPDKRSEGSDYFDLDGIACDKAGNIYITGIHRNAMDFGNGVTLPVPQNIAGWDGDTQTKRGDLFLVKFNPEGVAQASFRSSGDPVSCVNPSSIIEKDGMLYILGYTKGNNTNKVLFGDKEIVPSDRNCLFYTAITASNLEPQWAHAITAKAAGRAKGQVKSMDLSIFNDNLYLVGSFHGQLELGNEPILLSDKDQYLKGYVIKLDAKTGSFLGGVATLDGWIVETEMAFEMQNKIWVQGYDLGKCYLYEIPKDMDGSKMITHKIGDGNNVNAKTAAMIGSRMVYGVAYGKADFKVEGWDYSIDLDYRNDETKHRSYAAGFIGYEIEDTPLPVGPEPPTTGVEEAEANALQVVSMNGGLNLVAAEEVEVNIFNLVGVNVYNAVVENGNTFVSLPKGIYIVNGTKSIVF